MRASTAVTRPLLLTSQTHPAHCSSRTPARSVNSASLIVTPLAAALYGLPHLLRHSPPLQIEQTGSHSGCATHAPPWQTLLIVHESAGAQVSPSCCGSTAQLWLLA